MSLQHIQKNSPRLLPKPAKFEKNPPNGYRVIRKTKCGAGGAGGAGGAAGAGGAGGARSSPIHKQASLAGRLITDIDSNERHLFQNSEYVQKQGQGNQTNKQTISAQSETDKTPKIYNKDETHPKDTETLPNETRKSLSNESGKVDNGKSQSKAKDTEIHENRKQILTKYGEIIAKKYFGKDLHILFSKPEIKQETWLHLKDLEPWYSSKCQEIQKLPWVTSFSRIVTKTNQ